jgi:hypothetical protein
LPAGTVEGLLKDVPQLTAVLTYHVVSGKVLAGDVVKLDEAKTLQGQSVEIDATSGVNVNSARVVKADVIATNGVIHVIDEVLLPPSSAQSDAAMPADALIRHAINRGAPMFNEGHHAACTAIYEVAAMGLLTGSNGSLDADDRHMLTRALTEAQRTHDSGKSAWIMRHALDRAYESVSRAMN